MASPPTTNVDVVVSGTVFRLESLDRAVRVSLSGGRIESDAVIVTRAESFLAFLEGKTNECTTEERAAFGYGRA